MFHKTPIALPPLDSDSWMEQFLEYIKRDSFYILLRAAHRGLFYIYKAQIFLSTGHAIEVRLT